MSNREPEPRGPGAAPGAPIDPAAAISRTEAAPAIPAQIPVPAPICAEAAPVHFGPTTVDVPNIAVAHIEPASAKEARIDLLPLIAYARSMFAITHITPTGSDKTLIALSFMLPDVEQCMARLDNSPNDCIRAREVYGKMCKVVAYIKRQLMAQAGGEEDEGMKYMCESAEGNMDKWQVAMGF